MVVCIAENGVPEVFDTAINELGADVKRVIVGETDRDGWLNLRSELEVVPTEFRKPEGDEYPGGSDTLLVYFSSGTTGMPKMIEHDHTYPWGI